MSGAKNWQAGRRPERSGWSYRSERGSMGASRRHRAAKTAAAFVGLGILAAGLAYLASLYDPVTQPALAVLGDPLYRDLSLPPNAGASADRQTHVDLVALQRDAGHLFATVGDDADRDWNLLTADRLLSESQDRLRTLCEGLPENDRVAVIYCGLIGYARDGGAVLLVSDESANDRQFSAADWLRRLSDAAAESRSNVLVLLDPGPSVSSWRRGVLGNDFTRQLQQDLSERELPNLRVIVAAGTGETSWRVSDVAASQQPSENKPEGAPPAPASDLGRSVFSQCVVRGLCGERTDATGRPADTADQGPNGNGDGRISVDELYAFVLTGVGDWARGHRGVEQNVVMLGDASNFVVGTVTRRPVDAASAKADGSTQPEPANESSKPASDGKQTVAQGAANGTDQAALDPSVEVERKLDDLWRRRDELAAVPADAVSPEESQQVDELLLAAEWRLRFGLLDAAEKLLAQGDERMNEIANRAASRDLAGRFGGSWNRPFMVLLPLKGAVPPESTTASADPNKPLVEPPQAVGPEPLLDQAAKTLATEPIPQEQQLRELLAERSNCAKALDWLVGQFGQAKTREELAALFRVAALLPHQDLSPELRVIQRLQRIRDWGGPNEQALLEAAARVIDLTDRFGRIGLSDPGALSLSRPSLVNGLRSLAASQRWLIEVADAEEAGQHLRRADEALRQVDDATRSISEGRRLRRLLDTQLLDLVAWAAEVRERERAVHPVEQSYERLLKLSQDLAEIEHDAIASPVADWGVMQSRIDAAWAAADVDDVDGTGADLSVLLLGSRRLDRLLGALARSTTETSPAIEPNAAETFESLVREIRETTSTIKDLPSQLSGVIAAAGAGSRWGSAELRLKYASAPGLTAAERARLRADLRQWSRDDDGLSAARDPLRWEAGVWQGFWALQALRPNGAHSPEAVEPPADDWNKGDAAWQELINAAADADADADSEKRVLAARLDLGARIPELLANRRRHESAAVETPSQVAILLGLVADADALGGGPAGSVGAAPSSPQNLRLGWAALPIDGRPSATVDPELQAFPSRREPLAAESVTVASGAVRTTLPLRVAADSGRVYIKPGRRGGQFELLLDGATIRSGEFAVDIANPEPALRFQSALTGGETVTIALLDRRGFPIEIQSVRIVQEVAEDRWRIRFGVGPGGSTILDDAPGFLSLPPTTFEPLSLVPLLEYPASAPGQTATIEVQCRDESSPTGWKTVQGPSEFRLTDNATARVEGDLRRVPLIFQAAAPAATPAGQPVSPAPPAANAFDFANGLRFLLRVDGKQFAPRHVWPVTFRTNRFVSETVNDLRLEVVRRQGEPPRIEAFVMSARLTDPRVPKAIAVKLDFDQRLRDLIGQGTLTGMIVPGTGQSLKLDAQIAPGRIGEFDELTGSTAGVGVSLTVAGLPRAYRWRLRGGREPDRIQPNDIPLEVELVRKAASVQNAEPSAALVVGTEPAPLDATLHAAIVEPADLDRLALRFHVHELLESDTVADGELPRPWTVAVRRSEPGRRETSQEFMTERVMRRFDTLVSAAVEAGVWKVSVASKPIERPLGFSAAGRLELTAALRRPSGEEVDLAPSDVRLVIDGTAPESPRFIRPAAGAVVPTDQSLRVVCTASDPESGLKMLELRVDSNGSGAFEPDMDAVRRFTEQDFAIGSVRGAADDPWLREAAETVEWVVDSRLIPPPPARPGRDQLALWAVAQNRQGKTTESQAFRLELKRPKPKVPPRPPTTGGIVVTVKKLDRPPVTPEIVLVGADGSTEKKSGVSASFLNLKPGKYEIRVTQGTTQFKRSGAASVTVEVGAPKLITIQVK